MSLSVRDRMIPDPPTVASTRSASAAAAVMRDQNAGAVLVVEGDEIVGLVTDRDLCVGVIADATDPRDALVGDACRGEVLTVGADDPLDAAVQLMREHDVHRVLVADGDRLVGVLSLADVPTGIEVVPEP